MGGSPYWYFVPYRADVQSALDDLRRREFDAGRYYPVIHPMLDGLEFGAPDFESRRPGCAHGSIDEAQEEAAEEGTQSILDLSVVGERPDHGVAARVSDDALRRATETTQPTRALIEANLSSLLEPIERGHGAYAIVYEAGAPSAIWFAGYSYD